MKRFIRILFAVVLLTIASKVYATSGGDWGFGIQLTQNSKYSYTANFSDDAITYTGYGKYIRNSHTFVFDKDASLYALGIDADDNINLVINVEGNNKISRLVYEDQSNKIKTKSYTVTGSGILTIEAAALKDPYVYNENNKQLCNIGIKYVVDGESKSAYLDYNNGVKVTCDDIENNLKIMWSDIIKLDQYKNLPSSSDGISISYSIPTNSSGYQTVSNLSQWAKNNIKTTGKMEIKNGNIVINLNSNEEEETKKDQTPSKDEQKESSSREDKKDTSKNDDKKESSKTDNSNKDQKDEKTEEKEVESATSNRNVLKNEKLGILFETETDLLDSYSLEVEDITDDYKNNGNILLENRNLIKVYEIDVKNDNKIIPMKNGEYVIKIKLDNDVKKYDNYMVAFIENDTVKEQFETTHTSNELQFKTTHLSKYAVYGYNASKEEKKLENNNSKKDNKSYFWISIIIGTFVIAIILIIIIIKIRKKRSV